MKNIRFISLAIFFFLFTFEVNAFEKEVKEKIQKKLTFANPSKEKYLSVDNINGSIMLEGYDGKEVEILVHKTIVARSEAKIVEAKEKIRLEITEENNEINLFVDAPYRNKDGSINYRGWRYYGYDVTFDFELKVPHRTNLFLKTINDGEIEVKNVAGDFEIDNINGGIYFSGANGSGRVYALNGDVTVKFEGNPNDDSYFGSLNGEIEVTFLGGLEADFRFKTFNGDVYTDFPMTYLSPRQATKTSERGKFVYKADRSFGARVGNGGPELEFDGFNGDIYIIKK